MKTEAMLLLVEHAEEMLHGGHGAMSGCGLEQDDRGNAAAPRGGCVGEEVVLKEDRGNTAAPLWTPRCHVRWRAVWLVDDMEGQCDICCCSLSRPS